MSERSVSNVFLIQRQYHSVVNEAADNSIDSVLVDTENVVISDYVMSPSDHRYDLRLRFCL